VVVTTVLLLMFGEITPKILAMLRPVHAAQLVAVPLSLFVVVLTPARVVLRLTTNALLHLLRQGHVVSEPILTREEFRATVRTGKAQGGLDADEAELIHAIASFRTAVASEVMVPRTEMLCVAETATLTDAAHRVRAGRNARLPIYRDTTDHITGVLIVAHIPAWLERVTLDTKLADLPGGGTAADMPPLIVPPFLVPEMRHIDALLADMHDRNEHLAILLDEYGGTAGMVTRASILDALLGGMIGYGKRRTVLCIQPDGDVVASGCSRLAHINWDCNFSLPEDLDDTLAGYVMRLVGAVPQPGQRIADDRYEFTVLQSTRTRLDFIKIHPRPGAR
jgi:putative hemolysin